MKCILTILLLTFLKGLHAQDSTTGSVINLPDRYASSVDDKIQSLDKQLTKQTGKYLRSLSKQEKKLFRQLSKIDSSAASALLQSGKKQYEQLNKKLTAANGKADMLLSGKYLPHLDSLATSLSFLKDAKNIVSRSKDIQQQLGSSLQNLQ
ncbi:MAG: hypothetical protein KF746_28505, partial [Chitinophagaceae bacterium]|nr:hypothetical protein [Chitinophagaceae bacterium]